MERKVEEKVLNKNKFFMVFKYVCFFVLFFVLGRGNINGVVYPFALSMFVALVWCNQKILFLAPLYVVASYLSSFELSTLYCSLACAGVMLFCYGIHYKLKKPIKLWMLGIYTVLSQGFFLYYEIFLNLNVVVPLISVVVSILFLFICEKIFSAVLVRGFSGRLVTDEIICAGVVLLVCFSGLLSLNIYGFEVVKFVAVFLVLFLTYISGITTSIFSAGVMGLGVFLASSNLTFLAVFVLYSIVVAIFKIRARYVPALAILVVEIALGYYFKIYDDYQIINFISVVMGALAFVALPGTIIENISAYFTASTDRYAMKNIVNRNRDMISKRLSDLSGVFLEMDNIFRGMIKGGLTTEQAKEMLVSELKEKVCEECPERNKCHRGFAEDTNKVFSELVTATFERGKATLIDVPPFLTSRCGKINILINNVNTLSKQYQKYAGYMNNLDSSKVLVAEQLNGIGKVLKFLSMEVNKNISFDTIRENKLVNELTYHNVMCLDAVIFEQSVDVDQATLVIKNEDTKNPCLENVVSKICGNQMVVSSEEYSSRSGWSIVNFKTAPKYEIIFGTAGCTKATSSVSGDSYSIIKIDSDKFMMALCDGMGSGKKAERSSNLAMGLVENFYKAGFDNEVILSSVNKLLTLGNEEIFSALDLCVVDLRKGVADIIKLGAPCGYLRSKNETKIIESGALPLGILQEIQPSLKKIVLSSGDLIVLCTDGICDSFKNDSELSDFINNLETSNPQKMADIILEKALENCGGSAIDDMTIIVAKIFKL